MRIPRIVATPLSATLTLTACATDSEDAAQPADEAPPEAQDGPERVVVLGPRDVDPVIAFGFRPLAVRDWFGDQPDAVWPWAQDELGYEDFAVPWRDRTLVVARAPGEVEQAEAMSSEIEDQFAVAREANPGFGGATSLVGLAGADGQACAYGSSDTRSQVMVELGFEVPGPIEEPVPEDSFFVTLSQERFDELDADVLVWVGGDASAFDSVVCEPLYPERVAEEGRDLFLPYDPLGGAMSFASVLSLPFLIEELVPELQVALDGDPATTAQLGR